MSYPGDWTRIRNAMKRAYKGEPVTIGFLGGSITQGAKSTDPKNYYTYLVYKWWQEVFPQSTISYVNAGIGASTSQLGAARAKEDILIYNPDFIVVEYSVNDDNTPFFRETFEGMIRTLLKAPNEPALVILHNVLFDTGTNAQDQHELVGRHYGIPCVSMKTSIYRYVAEGDITNREVTADDLHPNDVGHSMIADLVIHLLRMIYNTLNIPDDKLFYMHFAEQMDNKLPSPMTANGYENAVRYRNHNCKPVLDGFVADESEQDNILDIFKHGWISEQAGDSIIFEVEGNSLALLYRKSIVHPACNAKAVIDGDEEHAVFLDANYDQDWGDYMYTHTLLHHGPSGIHTIKVINVDGDKGNNRPFYLVGVIASNDYNS